MIKTQNIAVAAIALATLGLASCVDATFPVRNRKYENADKYLVGSQSYEGEINALNVNWYAGKITIVSDATMEGFSVIENNELEDDKKVHSYVADGVLNVEFWKSGLISTCKSIEKNVTISVPALDSIDISSTSGGIFADYLSASTIEINKTSGTLSVGQMVSSIVDISSTSGSIEIEHIDTKSMSINSTSGSVGLHDMKVSNLDINSTSGSTDIDINEADTININKTSGSTEIKLSSEGATLSHKKKSGSFSTKLEYLVKGGKYIFGDGKTIINITTTSGSLRVE